MIESPHSNDIARISLLLITVQLIVGLAAIAQQTSPTAPLEADQVMEHVREMNRTRDKQMVSYSSLRTYHLDCRCLSHKTADMTLRVDYEAPDKKRFTILSESGSRAIRDRVFAKLLDAEQESMRDDNQRRSAITSENYSFRLADYEKNDADEVYVLDAQPRSRNKFLFRGLIWVDAKDFAITRVEGQPAINPSWWTEKTEFTRRYQRVGQFWLPESNESTTKVRVFGTASLAIEYLDYQITQSGGTALSSVAATGAARSALKSAKQEQCSAPQPGSCIRTAGHPCNASGDISPKVELAQRGQSK